METHNHMKEKGQEKFHSFYNALHCWILLKWLLSYNLGFNLYFHFWCVPGPRAFFFFFWQEEMVKVKYLFGFWFQFDVV